MQTLTFLKIKNLGFLQSHCPTLEFTRSLTGQPNLHGYFILFAEFVKISCT